MNKAGYIIGTITVPLLLLSCVNTAGNIKQSEFQEKPKRIIHSEVRQIYSPESERFEFITCVDDCPKVTVKYENGDEAPLEIVGVKSVEGVTLQSLSFNDQANANTASTEGKDTPNSKANVASAEVIAVDVPPKLDYEAVRRRVQFSSGVSVIGQTGLQALQEIVPLASQANVIFVRGRTDSSGNKDMNKQIAIGRAIEVKRLIVAEGVDPAKVKISYCTTCFVASNDTPEGRKQNRRVDVDLTLPQKVAEQLSQDKFQPVLSLTKKLDNERSV